MRRELENAAVSGAISFANSALKGIFIVNAGGIVATMAYIGNVDPRYDILLDLVFTLKLFVVGLVLSVMTALVAYGVQYFQTGRIGSENEAEVCNENMIAASEAKKTQQVEYWKGHAQTFRTEVDRLYKWETIFMITAPCIGIASLVVFGVAAWLGAEALTN